MTASLLLLLSSLSHGAVATRGLFEGVWASSSSFMVSTATQKATVGNGGICFPDATCQTTASGGAATVFGSSATVGAVGYTTSLATSAVLVGGWSLAASTASYGATASTFTSANASTTYHLHGNVTTTGGTFTPFILINADTGSNYTYNANCSVIGVNVASGGDTARARAVIDDENNGSASGSPLLFDVWLETRANDTKKVDGWFRTLDTRGGGSSKESCSGFFTYSGASVLTSFSFGLTSSIGFTGYLSVEQQRVTNHP